MSDVIARVRRARRARVRRERAGHGDGGADHASGGAVGRVGVPHYDAVPATRPTFYANVAIGGGPAPRRAYIDELLPDALEGRLEPGRVFDRVTDLDGVPGGYRAMEDREASKAMIRF